MSGARAHYYCPSVTRDGFPGCATKGASCSREQGPPRGGVAMDALMVDITDLPGVAVGDEAVILGRQGQEEITAHEAGRVEAQRQLRPPRRMAGATPAGVYRNG